MNVFCFTGALGGDCKVEYTQSQLAVCSFNVAVKSGYGDREKTTWARCQLFGKRAEGALPGYLVKGQKVAVSGELTLDEWQDQSGATQKMLKVRVSELDLIGDTRNQNTQAGTGQAQPQGRQNPPPQPNQGAGGYDQNRASQPQHDYNAGGAAPQGNMDGFDDDIPW